MKKIAAIVLAMMLVCCMAYAEDQPALETWANFNDNQKALYSTLDEIEEEIEIVFEYLGNVDMADGSREIIDLLFIIAPDAEDGLYVLDLQDGKFYDHINDKKVGEFKDREHVVNTLANCWASGNTEFLWYDMEVKLYMAAEEIQAVLDAAGEDTDDIPESEDMMGIIDHRISISNVEIVENEDIIEITLDNWRDYLEINQYLSVTYAMNPFGEATNTHLSFYTLLELKEEYSNYKADVAVEYDMDYCVSDIIYNPDDFSFELIDCVSHPDATVDESSFVRGETGTMYQPVLINRDKIVDGKVEQDWIAYDSWTSDVYRQAMSFSFELPRHFGTLIKQNEDGTGYIDKCPTNIHITRIEGTLEYNN